MNDSLKIGDWNVLTIEREVDFGLYLDGGAEGDILLPSRYVPEKYSVGEEIRVFIYLDQDERLIATTQAPLCRVGEFAYLECAWVNQYGAFLNWGLMKDLFCPFREQRVRMEVGNRYMIYVYMDNESYRLAATSKIERHLSKDFPPYSVGEEVGILVWQKTNLGYKVIVENAHEALVYRDQIFKPIQIGEKMRGFISNIRADGKIDVMLQPVGRQMTEDFAEVLLDYLRQHNGFCELGDKSDAELIKQRFQVSKKTYKRAIGDLYKRRLITIADDGIHLVQ